MSVQQRFQTIIDRLQGTAGVKTVYGEVMEVKGKTIIPVAAVNYCFGMCSCGKQPEKQERDEEGCGGMGGAISVRPIGVLEITQDETRFKPTGLGEKLVGALIFGLILGVAIAGRRRKGE